MKLQSVATRDARRVEVTGEQEARLYEFLLTIKEKRIPFRAYRAIERELKEGRSGLIVDLRASNPEALTIGEYPHIALITRYAPMVELQRYESVKEAVAHCLLIGLRPEIQIHRRTYYLH